MRKKKNFCIAHFAFSDCESGYFLLLDVQETFLNCLLEANWILFNRNSHCRQRLSQKTLYSSSKLYYFVGFIESQTSSIYHFSQHLLFKIRLEIMQILLINHSQGIWLTIGIFYVLPQGKQKQIKLFIFHFWMSFTTKQFFISFQQIKLNKNNSFFTSSIIWDTSFCCCVEIKTGQNGNSLLV